MEKKILVTGGAGYIGAHTVLELFNSGYVPVIVDNFSRSDETLIDGLTDLMGTAPIVYRGDCSDRSFIDGVFERHSFQAVMHFAAFKSVGESVESPLLYYQNNINSLVVVLEAMQRHHVKEMIFSSSCTVYGQPDHIPVDENAPFKRAESPYGATKQMCERILEDVCKTGLKIVSLRYFNPVGAHPTAKLGELPIGVPNNLVPFVTQTAIGKRSKLVVFGNDYDTPDGSNIRDFIHVVDLAKAHVKAVQFISGMRTGLYEVFNLGCGTGVSVLQLIKKFEETTGVKLDYEIGPRRPGDVVKTFANPSKANRILNWKTELSLADSLMDAWRWEQKLSVK